MIKGCLEGDDFCTLLNGSNIADAGNGGYYFKAKNLPMYWRYNHIYIYIKLHVHNLINSIAFHFDLNCF